jgi:hypothetical protein
MDILMTFCGVELCVDVTHHESAAPEDVEYDIYDATRTRRQDLAEGILAEHDGLRIKFDELLNKRIEEHFNPY